MNEINRDVKFFDEFVEKTDRADRLKVEVEKTRRAREIGQKSGLFYVPEIYDFDEIEGVVRYERIFDFQPLINLVNGKIVSDDLVGRVGRSLACIHKELELPNEMKHELPCGLNHDTSNSVFIHGDFNGTNVCVGRDGRLIIIDWQMTSVHGGTSTYGTQFFDLGWMINHFFFLPLRFRTLRCLPERYSCLFVNGYCDEAEDRFSVDAFSEYMKRFVEQKLKERKKKVSPIVWAQFVPYNSRFLRYANSISR